MDEILNDFLTETNESLGQLDVELVKLEQNPNDPSLLDSIFRVMHTVKGTCGFLGLARLEAVAHAGENVLGLVREGSLDVSAERISLILECLDRIRGILARLEETEAEPEGDDSDLIERLEHITSAADGDAPSAEAGDAEAPAAEAHPSAESESSAGESDESTTAAREAAEAAPSAKADGGSAASGDGGGQGNGQGGGRAESAVANQSIRVSVGLLENLMTTVSELVLTRNQLLQIQRSQGENGFGGPLQRLNHVVSELQEGVMKTRMQPIGNAWSPLPRIVRDLSHDLGKKIELRMNGEDTELDRQVLEKIKDPLTHMVRNAADHGLEGPEERAAAGKADTGTITLNAYHEGGHIIIEIADDGRGLDVEKIKAKALANGLTSEAEIANLSEQQILQFVFKPGFSTAEKVTSVSGRGVGMDVVRANIEQIGGTVELNSRRGVGTGFTVKIPLTLAIVSALIVECGGERFAIPQISVLELVRAKNADDANGIEHINGTPILRLRDRLLPLVNLRGLLRLDGGAETSGDGFIVVTQVGTYTFGIVVDRVYDTEEIVVKPVASILRHLPLFSGNTILGDGRVVMILDPNGIASAAGELTVADSAIGGKAEQQARGDARELAMLIFRAGEGAPKAVPLSLVARLENVDAGDVEVTNGRHVLQYRGQLMPLLSMDPGRPLAEVGKLPVLVFAEGDRSMGLVVDEIVDIVEEAVEIQLAEDRPGYLGTAVIAGRATDVVDTSHYLHQAFPDWFNTHGQADFEGEAAATGQRILVVDDSPFFRNMLVPLLKVAGYDVTTVETAEAALNLCEAGEDFDVILSDIEMPGMNGYELAESVQKTRWAETPLVALTSHATERDKQRGRAAGFREYVAKFDRDTLLSALDRTFQGVGETRGAA